MWTTCRKIYWSILVHELTELMHVFLFLCDLPLHNALLLGPSLVCNMASMTEVIRSNFRLSPNSTLKRSGALWLHLRRRCRVLDLMFLFVYLVLSLVLFILDIYLSSLSTPHLFKNIDFQFEWTLIPFLWFACTHIHITALKRLGNYNAAYSWHANLITQNQCALWNSVL